MRSRKTEIYGGLRGCIQKVIHFMHKVIPRYPVESPVDKVDSQFLRQVFTAVSCGAGVAANLWLGELRRLRRGNCADAARAHKRVDTCGFHPLENHPFPLDSLAQTRDRRPLRNKGNGSRGTVAWLSPPFRSLQITYCYTYGQFTLCRACGEQPTCVAVRYLTLRIRRYMARKAHPCGRKNLCRSLFSKRSPVSGLRQTKK